MTLLSELAKHDALMPMVEAGRKKAGEAQARMRAQAKAAKDAEKAAKDAAAGGGVPAAGSGADVADTKA